MNKSLHYFSLFILFMMAVLQLFGIEVYLGKSGTIKPSIILISIFFSLSIIYFIYIKFIFREEKYSICPNCEETFNFYELKNGKCKSCEGIDTIEIKEYYK